MKGKNEVLLQGYMKFPEIKETGGGNARFQAKIAVPFTYRDRATQQEKEGTKYVRISAWGDMSHELAALPEDTPIQVRGFVNERNYDTNCKSCTAPQKRSWTDVQVTTYTILE